VLFIVVLAIEIDALVNGTLVMVSEAEVLLVDEVVLLVTEADVIEANVLLALENVAIETDVAAVFVLLEFNIVVNET